MSTVTEDKVIQKAYESNHTVRTKRGIIAYKIIYLQKRKDSSMYVSPGYPRFTKAIQEEDLIAKGARLVQ